MFSLDVDKLRPEMLQQPGQTYNTCGLFTKNKQRFQKFKEAEDLRYIYQNKIDKTCFQYHMTYGDFKDSARRAASDKVLHYEA